jgi:hypothetical protein
MFTQHNIMLASLCVASLTALAGWLSAWNARRQARLSEAKLRNDLRDKVVEICNRVTDFYRALVTWDGSESTRCAQTSFIRAIGESRFLFADDPGVREILLEMNTKAFKVIGLKEHGHSLAHCPEEYLGMYTEGQAALAWFPNAIEKLEERASRYLS